MLSFYRKKFKNLSYYVEKEVKKSLYENETFLSLRWNIAEKNIIQWSTHYKKYTLLTLVLAALLSANVIYWQPILKEHIIKYIPEWKELLSWQGTILAGQLTIVGVVYPLVIGLISILFQNKSAKKNNISIISKILRVYVCWPERSYTINFYYFRFFPQACH